MAIREQVELLRRGADAWNQWRAQHRDRMIDLRGADLGGTDSSGVDLNAAYLGNAKLNGAKLSKADLSGADLSHVDLSGADLSGAILIGADLSGATLSEATLNGATLVEATLVEVDLSRAILIGVDLLRATLIEATLSRSNLSYASTAYTHFADIDLRTVKGLETIRHRGPSYISTSTFERSQGDIPEVFLRGAGLSDTFIEYVRSLVARPIEYYTCFLSYSSKDQDFAG